MGIESFEYRNNTVIVSNGEVTAMDVRSFLQGKIRKKIFPRETQFRVYAGSHGDAKGNIDADDYEIFKQLKAVINFVHKKEKKSIDEMKYRGLLGSDIKHISSSQDCAECDFKPMVREFFEELVDSSKPYVLFMAFCYTDRNVLTRYMLELGVIAVAEMKNDLGYITKGRCFKLNVEQKEIISKVLAYHEFRDTHDEIGARVIALFDRMHKSGMDPAELHEWLKTHGNNCQGCREYKEYHSMKEEHFQILYEEWWDKYKAQGSSTILWGRAAAIDLLDKLKPFDEDPTKFIESFKDHEKICQGCRAFKGYHSMTEEGFKDVYDEWCWNDSTPKNVILWGGSGTGKTVVLSELMNMRIAFYRRRHIPIRVIIAVQQLQAKRLMHELETKYFSSVKLMKDTDNIEINFYENLNCLTDQLGINISNGSKSCRIKSAKEINELLGALSKQEDRKTLLFIDEFSVGKQDWSNLTGSIENIDFFIAVTPWSRVAEDNYHVVKPTDHHIMAKQLHYRHRNCFEVYELWRHIKNGTNSQRNGQMASLNYHNDIIESDSLPEGRVPLWIQYDEIFSIDVVLGHISHEFIKESQSVTVINEDESARPQMDMWCKNDSRRSLVYDMNHIRGSEDDVIIICSMSDFYFLNELLTRPRQGIIIITKRG